MQLAKPHNGVARQVFDDCTYTYHLSFAVRVVANDLELGASQAQSPEELCRRADIIFLCLADSQAVRQVVLYGSGEEAVKFSYLMESGASAGKKVSKKHPFEGIVRNFERRWRETDSSTVREELGRYREKQLQGVVAFLPWAAR